jgi:hypothetical protein
MVSTSDSDSGNPGSIPGTTFCCSSLVLEAGKERRLRLWFLVAAMASPARASTFYLGKISNKQNQYGKEGDCAG